MIELPPMPPRKRPKAAYKKPHSVKHLEDMIAEAYHVKHPNLPIVRDKMNDSTANGLTKCIVKYIELKGGFASRISVQGTFNVRTQRYIPSTSRKGLADIMAIYNGVPISVEVKVGKDVQSDAQKKIEKEVNQAGGRYFIARDFSSFVEWIDGLI